MCSDLESKQEHCHCNILIKLNSRWKVWHWEPSDYSCMHTCIFASSLKIICNPKSIFTVLLQSLAGTCRTKTFFWAAWCLSFQLGPNKETLCLLVSALIRQKVFLPTSACATSFRFFCFLWVTVLFKMSSTHSAEWPSRWFLSKTAVMCLTNTYVC